MDETPTTNIACISITPEEEDYVLTFEPDPESYDDEMLSILAKLKSSLGGETITFDYDFGDDVDDDAKAQLVQGALRNALDEEG